MKSRCPRLRIALLILFCSFVDGGLEGFAAGRHPNFVIIFCDDMGYADPACFGSSIKTPNLDRMAKQGTRFTSFYAAQAVCSASRTALLTGCYPNRVGILGALGPLAKTGISSNEMTIAEVLKPQGYATAIYGKWHLGHHPQFLPPNHGFDEYFGVPYSNDMWPPNRTNYPPLPLIEGVAPAKVGLTHEDQAQLTTWYTEHAVSFIQRNKDRPFFLYLAHNMPHVPLHVSDKFKGKSARGLYGDVIMEIDWSVGQVLDTLKKAGVDKETLVVFTSDNGPWLLYGDHAGSAGPFREGKATMFDGGVREPCIMRWPGKIPAGRICKEMALTMDLLPTLAQLAGAPLPPNKIDGLDIWPLISGKRAKTPHEAFYYYWAQELQAVRAGPWKLHFPHTYPRPEPPGHGGAPGKYATKEIALELFNLERDVHETNNVAARFPEVVRKLEAFAEQAREDLGDSRTKRMGKNVRPAGRVAD